MNWYITLFYIAGYILVILGWYNENIFMFLFGLFWLFDSIMTLIYNKLKDITNKLDEIYNFYFWRK